MASRRGGELVVMIVTTDARKADELLWPTSDDNQRLHHDRNELLGDTQDVEGRTCLTILVYLSKS